MQPNLKNISDLPFIRFNFLVYFLLYFLIGLNLETLLKPVSGIFLIPVVEITSWLLQTPVLVIDGKYHFKVWNFFIDNTCSGIQLFWFVFGIISLIHFPIREGWKTSIYKVVCLLLLSYMFGLLANELRIMQGLMVQKWASIYLGSKPHYDLHTMVGYLIYFLISGLALFYYFFEKPVKNEIF